MFTKEEYKKFRDDYDRLGEELADAKEDGSHADKIASLQKELKTLEDKIHSYEREYEYEEKNEGMSFNKIKRYSYFKGYKKLKNKLKLFEDFDQEDELSTEPIEESAESRKLSDIAKEISADWQKVAPAAAPYLDAMHSCDTIDGNYGADSCASVVAYFLSNAASWKGDKAKAIKKELNSMLKKYYK